VPTYTYICTKCGHEFDVFHGMSEKPRVKCAACGHARCDRLIGTGAGIIFKGGGFYETDFKQKKGAPPAESHAKKDASESKAAEGKAAAKPEEPGAKKGASKPAKSSSAVKD